jgi:hypothetical protein
LSEYVPAGQSAHDISSTESKNLPAGHLHVLVATLHLKPVIAVQVFPPQVHWSTGSILFVAVSD